MRKFGESIGRQLNGGEVLELVGDVGAGKTTFVKGLAAGLGVEDNVQSPSFTISQVYDGERNLRLAHYDFYRLQDAGIMANELEEAINQADTIVAIEWADTVKSVLPEKRITLNLSAISENSRTVNIDGFEGVV